MTVEKYIKNFKRHYHLIHVYSDKNEYKVYQFRNQNTNKDIILRCYLENISIYEELVNIQCSEIPEIYDVLYLENGMIVLEEFIDGITVAQVLESGCYKYSGAKKVIKSICSALTILHKTNCVHRDIKPENVMIEKTGRVVLIDFNASRKISNSKKDTVVLGTIGYASPEQYGITQSDTRSDIYALGVLLNVMLTGKHPSEKLAKGKAARIVRKCTCVNPDERYQTVEKLSNAL